MIHRIIAVGRLRERHWQEAAEEYTRRLLPYARVEQIEIPEARIHRRPSEERIGLAQEGSSILERLSGHLGPVVALERTGRSMDSLELAGWLEGEVLGGTGAVAWVIVGPAGLDPSVLRRAEMLLSLSRCCVG